MFMCVCVTFRMYFKLSFLHHRVLLRYTTCASDILIHEAKTNESVYDVKYSTASNYPLNQRIHLMLMVSVKPETEKQNNTEKTKSRT